MTYGFPNIDFGPYPLNITNSIPGFAIDSIYVSNLATKNTYSIQGYRVFSGNGINIWLDKGIYSTVVYDQIGRKYIAEQITIPNDSAFINIVDTDIAEPVPPIGIAGYGDCRIVIDNCLPGYDIIEIEIPRSSDFDGVLLENIELHPGEKVIIETPPGTYSVQATDDCDASYSALIEVTSESVSEFNITVDYLEYDFSFPSK